MSEPDLNSDAAVFLVGLQVDGMEFAELCRSHLIDFAAEQDGRQSTVVASGDHGYSSHGGQRPFYTFLLTSPDDPDAKRLPEFDMLFGHWPRIFTRPEDIRDALHDTISEHQDARLDISIVIIANQPSVLLAHIGNDLLKELRQVFERNREVSTRFWIVGVLLSGPNVEKAELKSLLEGPDTTVQTIFLLGPSGGSTDFNKASNRQFEKLRFLVDLARDGGAKRELRQLRQSQRSGLFWLDQVKADSAMRSGEILSYVKSTLGVLRTGRKANDHKELFDREILQIRQKIAPDKDMPSDDLLDNFGGDLLKEKSDFRDSSLKDLNSFDNYFGMNITKLYSNEIEKIKEFVKAEDKQRLRKLAEIRSDFENLMLFDGGYSAKSQTIVNGHIESFKVDFDVLESNNKEVRAEYQNMSNMLSQLITTTSNGDLDDSDFAVVRNYKVKLENAKLAASYLPHNWWTFGIVAFLPLISLLVSVVSHAIGQNNIQNWALIGEDYYNLHGELFMLFIALFSLVVPVVLSFGIFRHFRNKQKVAFVEVRNGADTIINVVRDAVNKTRLYARYARVALLSREAARILDRRLASDDKRKVANQAAAFLQTVADPDHAVEFEDADELWMIAGHQPEREWFRRLSAYRLRKSGAKKWRLQIGLGEAVTGVDTDKSAKRDAPISVSTAWLSNDVPVLLRPLRLIDQPSASDDDVPSPTSH